MEHIGTIIPHANASREEGAEFSAAAVIAALNDVLARHGFPADQATAVSVHHRQARVRVSHGAVAGRIFQQTEHIIDDANTLLRQRWPEQRAALEGLTTKLG